MTSLGEGLVGACLLPLGLCAAELGPVFLRLLLLRTAIARFAGLAKVDDLCRHEISEHTPFGVGSADELSAWIANARSTHFRFPSNYLRTASPQIGCLPMDTSIPHGKTARLTGAALFAAALGAAFGDLLLTALMSTNPSGLIAIAIAAPLMFLASRHFLDPLSNAIRKTFDLGPALASPDAPKGRRLWALATGSAVLLAWAANVLGDYAQAHPGTVAMTILVSIAVVGGITLAWIVGARSTLPLAGMLGAIAGFVVNTAATIAVLASAGQPVTPDLIEASAASGLSVGLAGLAGGLVIDTGLARRPAFGAPLAALIAFAVMAAIGSWLAGTLRADFILPNITLGIGWLLGLSNSPSADALLRRAASERRPAV